MSTSQKRLLTTAVNKLSKFLYLILFACLFSFKGNAQDSCSVQVSLLTCSPGSELYSIFGHSALRIKDQHTGTDIVYNYGTFEFDDPDFYTKFVKGNLLYFLSQNYYADFLNAYAFENRPIAEQFLQLNCQQKIALQQFVWKNMQEENRYYKYDFLYDNCTTRLRDIIESFKDSSMKTGVIPQASEKTFRNALHDYLDKGKMHWSKLGIDLLLGAPVDKLMSNREAMFLPEYLETAVDSTKNNQRSLVAEKQFPLPNVQPEHTGIEVNTPLLIFTLLFILIVWLSFSPSQWAINGIKIFDNVYFSILGLLGCLFVFMWFGTDQKQMMNNFNLLWAWPTHILWILLKSKKSLFNIYLKLYLTVSILVLILWFFLPQQLNVSLIPIVTLAAFRSWKKNYGNEKSTIDTKGNSA